MRHYSIDCFEKTVRKISSENQIFIFGAGIYGNMYGDFFNKCDIDWEGYIDSNEKLYNTKICNKKVYSLDVISGKENVFVLIFLSYLVYRGELDGIKKQLINAGVDERNILYFGDCYELRNEISCFVNRPEKCLIRNNKLKNLFKGKRCFILGNGPSLRIEDLSKLSGEISMGCNGIIDLTNKIEWKPTCFFCEDSVFVKNHINSKDDLENILNKCMYAFTTFKTSLYKTYGLSYDSLFYLQSNWLSTGMKFSEDISDKIFNSGTTLYSMFQVAVYMGIKEIYLLGVDFTFRKESYYDGTIKINPDINNHMDLMEQPPEAIYNIDLIMEGYKCFKNYADEHEIKVFNATRGGKLEVFKRVDFDSLFM